MTKYRVCLAAMNDPDDRSRTGDVDSDGPRQAAGAFAAEHGYSELAQGGGHAVRDEVRGGRLHWAFAAIKEHGAPLDDMALISVYEIREG